MTVATLRAKYRALAPALTERTRRVWAATEARALGRGGPGLVARATGLSPTTISRGLAELDVDAPPLPVERVRRPGAGRKRATDLAPTLLRDLDALVEPTAPGDPDSPLRWTCLSTRTLAVALEALGHHVSHTVVAELLHGLGYSLQGNVKTREGRQHPDRDAQFRYIARQVAHRAPPRAAGDLGRHQEEGVGGAFKNGGRAWRPAKTPQRVRVHDFVIPGAAGGKAIPYGVYDLHRDEGWVSVGIDHDTATFAARSIRRWWRRMGRPVYAEATTLLITADAGGSNGARLRLWKWELQQLANRTGLAITVCHFPPGTSKWNKIEHRLFSHIAMNWRGTPLVDLATIVSLIGETRSRRRAARPGRTRPRPVPGGRHGDRRADGRRPAHSPSLPRGLELHHSPGHARTDVSSYFLTGP